MTMVRDELKRVARNLGKALQAKGHKVPHSVLLHALASASGNYDWHRLSAKPEVNEHKEESTERRIYECEHVHTCGSAWTFQELIDMVPSDFEGMSGQIFTQSNFQMPAGKCPKCHGVCYDDRGPMRPRQLKATEEVRAMYDRAVPRRDDIHK